MALDWFDDGFPVNLVGFQFKSLFKALSRLRKNVFSEKIIVDSLTRTYELTRTIEFNKIFEFRLVELDMKHLRSLTTHTNT